MTTTGVIVQSGHNQANGAQFSKALDAHKATLDATVGDLDSKVILLTEQAASIFGRTLRAWCDRNGWHYFHPTARGPRECAILSARPIRRQTYRLLTKQTLDPKVTNRSAPLFVTAAQPVGDDWFGVWHSPAHNEGLQPGNRAARVWRLAFNGLRRWRMTLHGRITIGGDFNADPTANKRVASLLAATFPHMKWAGDQTQKATEGGRVIDGLLTNRVILEPATTLPAQPGFDHKPVLVVLG